jgi:lysophospholipase L1-like esterase
VRNPLDAVRGICLKTLLAILLLFIFTNSKLQAEELKSLPSASEITTDTAGSESSQSLQSANPAIVPIPNETDSFWMPRHLAKLTEIKEQPVDLLLIGDSITQYLEVDGPEPWREFKPVWNKYYVPFNAMNLGFNGDTTANVLWRINHGEIDGIKPKVVMLEIGTNNTGKMHCSAEQTVEGIDTVVSVLHKKLPESKIVILKILPCAFPSMETNLKVNEALAQNYANSGFAFVQDLTDVFMQDGQLDRGLYIEGHNSPFSKALHPSSEGQEKIAKALRPLLQRLIFGESNIVK